MKTPMNGNGHNVRSQANEHFIYLPDGRSVALEGPTRKTTRRNGNQAPLPMTQPRHREIQFEQLANGGLVDLVREPPGELRFLLYRDGHASVQSTVQVDGTTFVPPNADRSLLEAVRWPKYAGGCDTHSVLLDEINTTLRTYLELKDPDYELCALFSLSTWLSDLCTVVPYLWVIGSYSCGKTTLLRLLSALCRRSVLAADMRPAALYSLCTSLRPTVLIDEFEPNRGAHVRDLQRLLRGGSMQGEKVFRGSKAYNLFGPKVIASGQESPDAALRSRALAVIMRPSSRQLPPLDEVVLEGIADRFQPKLLAFRLQNYQRAKAPELASVALNPRLRDIARALTLPLLGDNARELEVVEILRPHDAEAALVRRGEPEWAVAATLFSVCHRSRGKLTMGELAYEVYYTLIEAAETYSLPPRKVGDIVRALGIQTQSLGNQGRGIRLTQEMVKLIHETAKRFGLTRADILPPQTVDAGYGGAPCDLCQRLGLMVDDKGNLLRCNDRAQRPRHSTGLFGPARTSR